MQTRQPHPVTPADGTAPQAAYPPVDFDALSPQMRARIPPFSISGFLYSAARPHANKVIINGVALRAGQYVNDELMLKEINSDNIVMDFRGSLFRVGSDRLSGG